MAKRGFAAMDPERVRAISAAGGRAAHAAGTAHRWTSEAARAAGQKGGATKRSSRPQGSVADERQPTLPYSEDNEPVTQRAPYSDIEPAPRTMPPVEFVD